MIVAPARSAIRRWWSGGITRSSVPMTAQLGMVFQAGGPGRRGVGAERDRPLARGDEPPVGLGQVLGERLVHRGRLEERLDVALRRAGVADDVEHGRRVGHVERRARAAEHLEDVLALVGDERVDVDERPTSPPPVAGVGDHEPAVGVTDQHDGAGGALGEERRDVGGIDATPRSRFGGVRTVNPWPCSSVDTAFQLEPSAHAPWTRTMVGFGMV